MIFPPSMYLNDAIEKVKQLMSDYSEYQLLNSKLEEILSDLQELDGHIDDSCTD